MPKELPPYVGATGLLQELFKKIQQAPPPARFTQDFLFTNLKFKKSGSTVAFIPFLKRIGFLSTDGAPTDLYKKFRNPDSKTSGQSIASAIKIAYPDLYARNEYWHTLGKSDLKNFLIEVLEVEANNGALRQLMSTIEILKAIANFETSNSGILDNDSDEHDNDHDEDIDDETEDSKGKAKRKVQKDLNGLNLSYTINLNLPETSDIKVFDAIFKSLKENLLKK